MSSKPVGEIFRKGQIVPKRIGGVTVHKKARHLITFGCDVVVKGNNWTAIEPNGIAIVNVSPLGFKRKNGTRQKADAFFRDIEFNAAHLTDYIFSTF